MKLSVIKNIHCSLSFIGMVLLASCQEATIEPFDDINGIWFANYKTGHEITDSTSLTFVYEDADEATIPVALQLTGRPTDYDRPIALTVTSQDASENIDYSLPASAVLKAGDDKATYNIILRRTAALKTADKHIDLRISANEYFSLPITFLTTSGGEKVTTLEYHITFSDRFTVKPSTWRDDLLGVFSQQKFELICRVLDIHPSDFTDDTIMTLSKQQYICLEMTDYVKDEIAKRDAGQPYDTDVIDNATGLPMKFYV